jgi:hypothetical protein
MSPEAAARARPETKRLNATAHESARTVALYDPRRDDISLDEVEQIAI